MPVGLIALAIGGFGIGLTEFVIMGLLPEVAADFGVSEAAAGWLISGYALAVVVGALGLTAAVTRFPRKPVLLGLLVLFIAGNLRLGARPRLRVDDGRPHRRRPLPRRVLRHRRGGRRRHGRPDQEGRRHRDHVHRPHRRQRARRAVRHPARPGSSAGARPSGHHRASACSRSSASLALVPTAGQRRGRRRGGLRSELARLPLRPGVAVARW